MNRRAFTALFISLAILAPHLYSEEGMWTFNNLPIKAIKEKYGFEPTQEWLDHVRLSSLRFPNGSGSFISSEGLVLTNHHIVRGNIQSLSTKDRDLLKDGFVAESKDMEIKLPGLELLTLKGMVDITERVDSAVRDARKNQEIVVTTIETVVVPGLLTPNMSVIAPPQEFLQTSPTYRDRVIALEISRAQEELRQATGLHVEPVTLYQGGEIWLYAYEKHTDVRLVMAPEFAAARFGQDFDNFTYPRHHMDCAFVRVYRDNKPYRPEHFLNWSKGQLKSGDLVFISGHPGATNRLWTVAQMLNARDVDIPLQIKLNEKRRNALESFAGRNFEARAQLGGQIYSIDNSLKTTKGRLEALFDEEAIQRLKNAESDFQKLVAANPDLRDEVGSSWSAIENALKISKSIAVESAYVGPRGSELLATALTLIRLPVQIAKEEINRLPEFNNAAVKTIIENLTRARTTPFNRELEIHMFTEALKDAKDALGYKHPFIKAVLNGKKPSDVAKDAVNGTKLHDPEEIALLLADGKGKAISKSKDPFIVLARKIDPLQRELREKRETRVDTIINDHSARIARARLAIFGKDAYPDATFTLRMTYGAIAPYPAMGTHVQPFTTMHGLFDRFEGWGGTEYNLKRNTWLLPKKWLDAKPGLGLATPYNFVSTTDFIGGNSGSPVIDRHGELVGLAFDGNWESNAGRFYYDGRANRTISVDARGMAEMLKKVYRAESLLDELRIHSQ